MKTGQMLGCLEPTRVVLKGSPRAIGLEHGAALAPEIAEVLARQRGAAQDAPGDDTQRRLAAFDAHIEPEYAEELAAVAYGAGLDYEDLVALSAFTEMPGATGGAARAIDVVAFGAATRDGSMLHGHNFDLPADRAGAETWRVFEYRPQTGNRFVAVGLPGMTGVLAAMNAAGLTITATPVGEGPAQTGLPLSLLLRRIAQYANGLDDAYEMLRMTPRTGGANITISDWRTPEAMVVEATPSAAPRRKSQASLLVVANNHVASSWGAEPPAPPSATMRYLRMCDLAERAYGDIDLDTLRVMLRDRYDGLRRRDSMTENSICNGTTAHSVMFSPAELAMWVSASVVPAPDGIFTRHALDADRSPDPAWPFARHRMGDPVCN